MSLCLLAAASMSRATTAPVEAFDPNFNGIVHAALVQPDGAIVMGGAFTGLHPGRRGAPQTRDRLARFAPDGALDAAFAPAFDGPVRALALDATGRLLVGGGFTTVTDESGAHVRHGLVRIRVDGSVDPDFAPQFAGEATWRDAVLALAVLADGRIAVGGAFRTVATGPEATPAAHDYLALLESDGTPVAGFDPALNHEVLALAAQRDGGFIATGAFTQAGDEAVGRIARFASNGSLDTAWDVAADNLVRAIAIESDGSILLGGDFLALRGTGEAELQQQLFLARLSVDGVRDTAYHPRPDGRVTALAIEHAGTTIVGGEFTKFLPFVSQSSQSAAGFARLERDGQVDTTFRVGPSGTVNTIALQEDGGIVLGGHFVAIYDGTTGVTSTRLFGARVNETGRIDAEFTTGGEAVVLAAVQRGDGAVYVGGSFANFAGVARSGLALVQPDGTVDASFAPELNGSVTALALQDDGKLVVGGAFTTIDDVSQPYLARLNPDGSLDTSYDPQPNATVRSLLRESSGAMLVGGGFTGFTPGYDADTSGDDYEGVSRAYLARVLADGSIDEDWTPLVNASVNDIARQSDGRLLIAGGFTTVGTETRAYVARLETDGDVDEGFNPAPNGVVNSVVVDADGRILIGGEFTLLQLDDGQADDDDGDDVTDDDADRYNLARINADGSLDQTFTPTLNGAVVDLEVMDDGDILVGGEFNRYAPDPDTVYDLADSLVRLNADGTRDDSEEWNTDGSLQVILPLADGDYLLGGAFRVFYSTADRSVRTTTSLVRYAPSGVDTTAWATTASVDPARYVSALTVQRTGHVLAAGRFDDIGGVARQNVARFTADGSVLSSFNLRSDGAVHALLDRVETGIWDDLRSNIALLDANGQDLPGANYTQIDDLSGRLFAAVEEPDGSVLLGGFFTNTANTSGPNLVRLRPDGTFDPDFRPTPDATVTEILLQPDGRIVIVGSFTEVDGVEQSYAARLLSDGSYDDSFVVPAPSASISAAALQADGKVLIGGNFTTFQVDDGEEDDDDGDGATNDDTRQAYIARLNADGTLDTTFAPITDAFVGSFAIHPDGDITMGGQFTVVTSNDDDATTYARSGLARISSTGVVDADFDPSPNSAVWDLDLLDDGRLIVAGGFTLFTNLTDNENDDDDADGDEDDEGNAIADEDADVYYLARLNADGTLDTSFDPRPNATVREVHVQADGAMLVRGDFGAFFPNDAEYGLARAGVARVLPDGGIDQTFNPNPDDGTYAMLERADGSILIGGDFTRLDIEAVLYLGGAFTTLDSNDLPALARVQLDGNPDGSYRPAPNGDVNTLVATPDGRILVGGAFTQLHGQTRQRLARLASNGSLDTAFAPVINGPVRSVALDQQGGIIVTGEFSQVGGASRTRLARLWNDGALDAAWAPTVNGTVDAVAVDLAGRVLVAGAFTTANGSARAYLARFDDTGALDTTFTPSFDGRVYSVVLRADGLIGVGGDFTTVNGSTSPKLAVLGDDGTLAVAGNPATNGTVRALTIDREGRLVAGGSFTRFAGASRALLARTNAANAFGQALLVDDDGRGLTWVQTGGGASANAVSLAVSTDGETWSERGFAWRRDGSSVWRWEGNVLPIEGEYVLRVRTLTSATQFGSGSVREYYRHFIGTQPSGYGYGSTLPTRFGAITGDLGDWLPGGDGITVNPDGSGGEGGNGGGDPGDGGIDILGSRLRNLSTRVSLELDDVITVGFVVEGSAPRRVLLRAVGPGLAPYLGAGELESPRLALHNAEGAELAVNTGWQSSPQMRDWFAQAGAFSLTPGSADAVLAPVLAPGPYTLAINDEASAGGIVLAEVYDLGAVDVADRLVNLSALSRAGDGEDSLIVGFVIEGNASKTMLIRGIGPTLEDYGVSTALADVAIDVRNAAGELIARNEDWATPLDGGATATVIATQTAAVGAFALATDAADAAVLVELAPGAYTVQLQPRSEDGRDGLIEIYEVAP